MTARKIISLILVTVMLISALASCGGKDDGEVTRPHKTEVESPDDNFVSADYNGDDFTFLTLTNEGMAKDYYCGNYIDAEAITGDTISDAVFERNLAAEEKYNVKIVERKEFGDPNEVLRTFIMSGDFCYDVIYGWGYKMGNCITENYLADFNELPNADLSKDYWSPSAAEDLSVARHSFLCINDISMNKLEWSKFFFFNKQVAEDYNVYTEFGDLYQLVRDGKWTLDKFFEILSSISHDVDGNGVIDKNDVYGLLDGTVGMEDFLMTSGINIVEKNEDGSYSPSFYSEKTLDLINKINPVYTNKKIVKNMDDTLAGASDTSGYKDIYEYSRSFFATDHCLFLGGSAFMTSEFRNMKSAYGILPIPKYDEAQQSYVSTMYPLASIFAIPATPRNDMPTASMERTGTILEYLAYKSNEILLPTYYDTILGGQRLDAPEDMEMLDLIRDNIRYNFVDINGVGWPSGSNDSQFRTVISSMFANPTSATSSFKRSEKKLQKLLDDFYYRVLELDEKNAEADKNK